MSIVSRPFGVTPGGQAATLYTLTNAGGASVSLCDLGARIVSICVPDRDGHLAEVCLGFDDVSAYASKAGASVGATIGRVANRIGQASFVLNGQEYRVSANEGHNCLHGGAAGFHTRWWRAACQEGADADLVTFRYESADGEEGFPGQMTVEVTYAWTDKNELCIHYQAVSDRDTLCNLTNHAYFILDDGENALDHEIQIFSDRITATDDALIPTGKELDVSGLPVDLRQPLRLRDGLARAAEYPLMVRRNGYDFNYRVNGEGLRLAAVLRSAKSGRAVHVCTTEPCIQLYTGQHFNTSGHGGRPYGPWAGVALETQHHPDAIHHPNFPSVVLRAGEVFNSQTVYSFTAE